MFATNSRSPPMWTITKNRDATAPVVGALRTMAELEGEASPDQHAWIEHVAERHDLPSADVPTPSAEQLARALPDPDERHALVGQMVLVALAGGRVTPAAIEHVHGWARDLGVTHPATATLHSFSRGRFRRLTMQIMRRSFIMTIVRTIWREQGLRGLWRVVLAGARVRNRAKAARYQALAELPEGTLGRTLYEHCRANDFAFPGERGGTPEFLLFHDVGHALTGHATDGPGEVQMAGFEAGFMGGADAYSITLAGLYAFGLGAPIIPDFTTRPGDFSTPAFLDAYRLGEALSEDLRFWDPWPSMDQPVENVRRDLGWVEVASDVAPATAGTSSASPASG